MASDSAAEISREIKRQIEAQGEPELRRGLRDFGREIVDYMKSISPEDLADDNPIHYIDSFSTRIRSIRGKLPSLRISNNDPLARIIEDGSGILAPREQGGSSEPHYVFARAAFAFGGKTDDVGGDEDDEA